MLPTPDWAPTHHPLLRHVLIALVGDARLLFLEDFVIVESPKRGGVGALWLEFKTYVCFFAGMALQVRRLPRT